MDLTRKRRRSGGGEAKREKEPGKKVQIDRLTLILAVGAVACSFLWSILATYILYDREKQSRAKIEKLITDVKVANRRLQSVSSDSEALKRDIDAAKITHRQLGILFQQLLFEEHQPQNRDVLLGTFDKLFKQVSGKPMDFKQRDALIKTTNRLWGDGTQAAAVKKQPAPVASGTKAKRGEKPPPIPVVAKKNVVPPKPPPPPKGLHVNKPFKYQVVFPDNWKINSGAHTASVMATGPRASQFDLYPASVLILARKLSRPMSVDDYAEQNLGRMTEDLSGFEKLGSGSMTVGGEPALFMKCRFKRLNTDYESIYILVVKNEMGYVLMFSSTAENFPRDQAFFNQIYESVSFM